MTLVWYSAQLNDCICNFGFHNCLLQQMKTAVWKYVWSLNLRETNKLRLFSVCQAAPAICKTLCNGKKSRNQLVQLMRLLIVIKINNQNNLQMKQKHNFGRNNKRALSEALNFSVRLNHLRQLWYQFQSNSFWNSVFFYIDGDHTESEVSSTLCNSASSQTEDSFNAW